MRECVLVIDFGTSYFKTAVLDDRGAILAIDRTPTPIHREGARSEIAIDVFHSTVKQAITNLDHQQPGVLKAVRGITFCTQANTFVLLDAEDKPLTPLIVWNDDRAHETAAQWIARLGAPPHRALTGIPQLAAQFGVMKLKWLEQHHPQTVAASRKMLFIGDYFTHWLTGRSVTDCSVAALTGVFDIRQRAWSTELCQRIGIDPAQLPEPLDAGTALGPILADVADELGLPRDCVFAVGILDQYAGAIGVGNAAPGDFSETTGTVLATIRSAATADAPPGDDVFVGPGVERGTYYHMSFGDVSASLLEHYRRQLPDKPSFETLDAGADFDTALKLDHRQPVEQIRQTIAGWATTQPRGAVVACIYRTVAGALRDQVHALLGGEAPPGHIASAGGASRSRRWLQVKADTLGFPVMEPRTDEPTLVGCASLIAPALAWPRIRCGDPASEPGRLIRPTKGR